MSKEIEKIKEQEIEKFKENILVQQVYQVLKPRFLNYAMSVIIGRALPDVRDGLKPVHRRILFGMDELGLKPNGPYKKSARVVGEVLGKYHPHGDSSVYSAMVILAQDFSTRYPLVDGHGNFGSIDGDSAAAMRYTESKLTRFGQQLLKDIKKNTINFIPNYDGEEVEPQVLPTLLPNLLVNGSFGIAVGMTTNIPPHNLRDVYRACNVIINDMKEGIDSDIEDIINAIVAPDMPTGGIIMGLKGIKNAYRTGEGSFMVRGVHEVVDKKNGSQIIITELPYKVNKAKLIESIADLVKDEKITGISDIRDESSKEGMRIVIDLKKDANPSLVINNLIKHTSFQVKFSAKLLALVNGKPQMLNIKEVLTEFLAHAAGVIINRTQFDLNKDSKRLNIVDALIRCAEDKELLNTIINIVTSAEDPMPGIIELGFNEAQADHILESKVRSLSKANLPKLKKEQEDLTAHINEYNAILSDQSVLLDKMSMEFKELEDLYGDDRRSELVASVDNIEDEDLIKDETLIITYTTDGIIKAVEEKEYKSQKRGGKGVKAANTKEDEIIKFMFTTNSKDDLLFFTNEGRCHVLKAYKIAKASKTAKGKSINNYLELNVGEKIVSVLNTSIKNKDKYLLFITEKGKIKKFSLQNLSTRYTVTKVIKTIEDDKLIQALLIDEGDNALIVTQLGMSLRIDTAAEGNKAIRPMGRDAIGVAGINLQPNDKVVDMCIIKDSDTVLTITENGLGKRTKGSEFKVKGRGSKGMIAHTITERTGVISAAMTTTDDDFIFIATKQGLITKTPSKDIQLYGRSTQGVKVINLNENDKVASVSIHQSEPLDSEE